MKVGAAWNKVKDGKEFISADIDDDVKPLVITKGKGLMLFTNDKKTEPKHPDYTVHIYEKKPKENSDFSYE
ncbi:MAG: hypothetical protein II304_02690 [Bacteroidales bacterium]|nr:hypothetical protein [Bacteroidales bacterium]